MRPELLEDVAASGSIRHTFHSSSSLLTGPCRSSRRRPEPLATTHYSHCVYLNPLHHSTPTKMRPTIARRAGYVKFEAIRNVALEAQP